MQDSSLNAKFVVQLFKTATELTKVLNLIVDWKQSENPERQRNAYDKLLKLYPAEMTPNDAREPYTNIGRVDRVIQGAFSKKAARRRASKIIKEFDKICSNVSVKEKTAFDDKIYRICNAIYQSIRQETRTVNLMVTKEKRNNEIIYPTGYTIDIISAFAQKILNNDDVTKDAMNELMVSQQQVANNATNISDDNFIPFDSGDPIGCAKVKITIDGKQVHFSDCTETVIRQLLALALGEKGKNHEKIDTKAINGSKLAKFLDQTIGSGPVTPWRMANDSSAEFREEWAKVCSGLNAAYKNIGCELLPTPVNLLKVIHQLVTSEANNFNIHKSFTHNYNEWDMCCECTSRGSTYTALMEIERIMFALRYVLKRPTLIFIDNFNTGCSDLVLTIRDPSGDANVVIDFWGSEHVSIRHVDYKNKREVVNNDVNNQKLEFYIKEYPIIKYYSLAGAAANSGSESDKNNATAALDNISNLVYYGDKKQLFSDDELKKLKRRITTFGAH
jgi:hypothetical protein